MSKTIFSIALAATFVSGTLMARADDAPTAAKKPAALDFTMESLDGKQVDLSQYTGKVVMVVNTASFCGFTKQYKPLETLYKKYESQGLVILGFPCNQFKQQEPGTASEIKTFCTTKYGVTFPMFAKVEVNGADTCPLYKYLKSLKTPPKGAGDISWNFEKFIIGRNGEVVARFKSQTSPDSEEVVKIIDAELAKK